MGWQLFYLETKVIKSWKSFREEIVKGFLVLRKKRKSEERKKETERSMGEKTKQNEKGSKNETERKKRIKMEQNE